MKLARGSVHRVDALAFVSYQNRQCIYTMLVGDWSDEVKLVMGKYLEVHQNDGITLYYLFCQHYAGTAT